MSDDAGARESPAPEAAVAEAQERRISRAVWAVSVPLLFAEISETLIHVTDTIFLARVGTTELAAIALADVVLEIWLVPVVGLVEATQIVIARRRGEQDDRAAGATFNRGFGIVLLLSLALAAGLALAAPQLAGWVASSSDVAEAVEGFVRIAAFGLVFHALGLAYSALYVGLTRARILVWATVVLASTNLVLSYVLIFGKLGLPRLGIEGAAIGFVAAEVVTFAFLTVHTLARMDRVRFGLFRRGGSERGLTVSLARTSTPAALQGLLDASRWLLFFIILERVSEEALAWSNIVYAAFALFLIPTEAFAETAYSLVSTLIGRGWVRRIGTLVRKTMSPTYVVTLVLAGAVLVFPHEVLSVFTDDPAAIEGSLDTLRLVAVAMLVVIPAEMWLAAVFGTGDTDAALAIDLVGAAVMVAWAYVTALVLDLSLPYVWLSLPVAALVSLPLAYGWMRAGRWRRREI